MPDDGKITITLDPLIAQQLVERAREEGVSPEQYAADLVADAVADDAGAPWPPLSISDEELRTSIESQRRDIAAGTAKLYAHDEVVVGARAILAKARRREGVKTLVWTSAARADLDAIAEYHAHADQRVGDLLIGRIEQAVAKLARHDTGRPGRIDGTREKSVADASHVVIYEIHDDLLFIFRIVHTARNWP